MLRSLHMKLVMIMVLLILSLMTVVGAFLINSVMAFYLEDFYTQMSNVFARESLTRDLTTATQGEEDGAQAILDILETYSGELGLNGYSRTLFILDGETGEYLAGNNDDAGKNLSYDSANLTHALATGEDSSSPNMAADYMDVAITRGPGRLLLCDL